MLRFGSGFHNRQSASDESSLVPQPVAGRNRGQRRDGKGKKSKAEAKASLQKRIRDTTRLLKREGLPANIRVDAERKLKALQIEHQEKQTKNIEREVAKKYRMVRFFERKTAEKNLERAEAELEDADDDEKDARIKAIEEAFVDVHYIKHYPKRVKYISLFPKKPCTDAKIIAIRDRIREGIRQAIKEDKISDPEWHLPAPSEDLLVKRISPSQKKSAGGKHSSDDARLDAEDGDDSVMSPAEDNDEGDGEDDEAEDDEVDHAMEIEKEGGGGSSTSSSKVKPARQITIVRENRESKENGTSRQKINQVGKSQLQAEKSKTVTKKESKSKITAKAEEATSTENGEEKDDNDDFFLQPGSESAKPIALIQPKEVKLEYEDASSRKSNRPLGANKPKRVLEAEEHDADTNVGGNKKGKFEFSVDHKSSKPIGNRGPSWNNKGKGEINAGKNSSFGRSNKFQSKSNDAFKSSKIRAPRQEKSQSAKGNNHITFDDE